MSNCCNFRDQSPKSRWHRHPYCYFRYGRPPHQAPNLGAGAVPSNYSPFNPIHSIYLCRPRQTPFVNHSFSPVLHTVWQSHGVPGNSFHPKTDVWDRGRCTEWLPFASLRVAGISAFRHPWTARSAFAAERLSHGGAGASLELHVFRVPGLELLLPRVWKSRTRNDKMFCGTQNRECILIVVWFRYIHGVKMCLVIVSE